MPWVLIACAAVVVHALVPDGPWRGAVLVAAGAGAVIATVGASRRLPSADRVGWVLLASGLGLWVLGDLAWTVIGTTASVWLEVSADLLCLTAYPLVAVGLVRAFPVARGRGAMWVLDAFLLVGGIALVLWLVVLNPELARMRGGLGEPSLDALYPVADIALLVVLVRPFVASTPQVRAHRTATCAVLVLLVVDVLHQVAEAHGGWSDRLHVVESGWLLGYLLLAWAAWSAVRDDGSLEAPDVELGPLHVGLIAVSAGIVPATLVVAGMRGGRIPLLEVCTVGIFMLASVLFRFGSVVQQLRGTNAHLARLALTDPLTGLANAAGAVARVERPDDPATSEGAGSGAPATGSVPGLVLISLDGYRDVVETLGHEAADDLLRTFAGTLREAAPPDALAARLSRHVFAVVVETAPAASTATVQVLLDRIGAVQHVRGMDLDPGVIAGFALARSRPWPFSELAARADAALDAARRRREPLVLDGAEPDRPALRGGDLMPELARAAADGELVVHYQPVVGVQDQRLAAAEALVRWQHPVHGLLSPDAFVPAAERVGMVHVITRYVLDDALQVCARVRSAIPTFTVAVNISAHDLDASDLVDRVHAALRRHDLPASALALEVTETMAMRDVPRAERTLRALDALGVHLAVDDYGVGYGSLDYLRRLPFSVLKVDRVFVGSAAVDPACAAILRSTVSLGHALGMHVVAEGAEDEATLDLLRDVGCDSVQGWVIARPAPASDLDGLIGRADATQLAHPDPLR